MRPNIKQVKTIKSVVSTIQSWEGTNDINSSTHSSDIGECLTSDLYDAVSEEKLAKIEKLMVDLWNEITEIE